MVKYTKDALFELIKANKFDTLKSKNPGVQRILEESGDKLDGILELSWNNTYNRHNRNYGKAYVKLENEASQDAAEESEDASPAPSHR